MERIVLEHINTALRKQRVVVVVSLKIHRVAWR